MALMPSYTSNKPSLSERTKYCCFLIIFALVMASFVMALEGTSSVYNKCNKEIWPGIKMRFIAFDFDGTCTTKDTTSLFYKATEKYQQSSGITRTNLDKSWEELGKTYYKGHVETITGLLPKVTEQKKDLNIEGLREFLAQVYAFDSSCTKKVDESGLLAGITKDGIHHVAKQVELRPGCVNILNKLNLPLHIISFNWSEDLINVVLSQLKQFVVTANNFQFHNNQSKKYVGRSISSPQDKEDAFGRLLQTDSTSEGLSVYIGDSIGDVLPLLKANIGIVIGSNEEFRQVSTAFGIRLIPLSDLFNRCHIPNGICFKDNSGCLGNIKGTLYETSSWNEIGEFLLGKTSGSD